MADDRAKLLAKFIEPLRVKPGSKVKLAKDFDPGYKASFLKKKEGATILQAGVDVLAEYQARLAAQDTWGCWSACRRWMPAARTARSGT
jgi:hypothetical protein